MNCAARKFAFFSAGILTVLATWGCAEHTCPPIVLDTAGVSPVIDYQPLAEVLADCVLGNGLADREQLPRHAKTLDRQLAILAVTGPTATPDLFSRNDDVLAYWYNAHAAWSMKLLVARRCPRTIRAEAMLNRKFPLDGRAMTLREVGRILAKEKDFRIVAAVPGATTCNARLPDAPIDANGFGRTVERRFAELLNDDMRVYIDVVRLRVLIPPALWQFRDRLVDEYERKYRTKDATLVSALLSRTEGAAHRRLQEAIGYREVQAIFPRLLAAKHKNDRCR